MRLSVPLALPFRVSLPLLLLLLLLPAAAVFRHCSFVIATDSNCRIHNRSKSRLYCTNSGPLRRIVGRV